MGQGRCVTAAHERFHLVPSPLDSRNALSFPSSISLGSPPVRQVFRQHTDRLAIDLVSKLLVYSPNQRLTAAQALAHPFFHELRQPGCRMPDGKPLPPLFNFNQTGPRIPPHLYRCCLRFGSSKFFPHRFETLQNFPITPLAHSHLLCARRDRLQPRVVPHPGTRAPSLYLRHAATPHRSCAPTSLPSARRRLTPSRHRYCRRCG